MDMTAHPSSRLIAGGAFLTAGALTLMAIITAEALYPRSYSTRLNEISDLGGSRPPHSVILQPSATIFDLAMVISGVLVMVGALFLYRSFRRPAVVIATALLGLGVLGVGLFPGNTAQHPYFALAAFVGGGLAAVLTWTVAPSPLRYAAVILGAVTLAALIITELAMPSPDGFGVLGMVPLTRLGVGGLERWIVYPVVLWLVSWGGYLMGSRQEFGARE